MNTYVFNQEKENTYQKNIDNQISIAALYITAKNWKNLKRP